MQKNLSTRRLFIQRGLVMLAAAPTIPTFLDQTVLALSAGLDGARTQKASGKDGTILVVVQMAGGNDGLNMVVPFGDDAYYRARPTIGVPKDKALKIDHYIGLHPNLAPLKRLYDEGHMSVIQGVGYPNPNRSHFRSMDIWQSGQPDHEVPTSGWIGRYFDNACPGCDPHVGVSIGGAMPLAMQGDRVLPLAFEKPDSYRYNGTDKDEYMKLNKIGEHKPSLLVDPTTRPAQKMGKMAKKVEITPASELDFLHRTAMDAQVSSDDILRMTRTYQTSGKYPQNEFGQGLKTVAAMIAGGLPTRVYYVSLGGFDTHAQQVNRHDQLMTQLGEGIAAFMDDLAKQKNRDRVLLMTFSEFGRRVAENANGGTDHGSASIMFALGSQVKQGLYGDQPSMTQLVDNGNLSFTTDFRSVYATVIDRWLGVPPDALLGKAWPELDFIPSA